MPGSPYNLSEGDTQLVITDLTHNTNYSITVCAFTSIVCGPLSSRVNQTDEDGKVWMLAFVNWYCFFIIVMIATILFLNSSPGSH